LTVLLESPSCGPQILSAFEWYPAAAAASFDNGTTNYVLYCEDMRVLLLSVGSRGDVEPYCALTQELLKRNHQVDLFLQRDLAHLAQPFQEQSTVPSKNHPSSFQLHIFPFTNQDFYKCQTHHSHHNHHPDPKMKNVGIVADIIGALILPCVDQVLAVVKQQQEKDKNRQQQWVIVTSAFTRCLSILIGQALDIPTILLHLQPLVPNRIFPSYRTSRTKFVQACCRSCLDDNVNDNNNNNNESNHHKNDDESVDNHYCEETYWKIEHALEEVFLKDRMTLAYQKLGIMSPLSWEDLQRILSGRDSRFWMVNAYSNHLIPSMVKASPNTPVSGVGEYVLEVGPLADGFLPPDTTFGTPNNTSSSSLLLEEFLNSCKDDDNDGPYPICVGFGSMPFHQAEIVLDALERLDQKAVLVGNALRVPNNNSHHHPHRSKVFTIASVPYAYLLPRCSMMLCHGGAGVVQACLRAGIPCLVSPIMGDQFAFGQLVQAKGLGTLCGSSGGSSATTTSTKRSDKLLTCEDIVQAIKRARLCRHKCQELGEQIRRGERQSGVQKLVDLMETMT
jgi:hypothetical protein